MYRDLNAPGWKPQIQLGAGLKATYDWFVSHQSEYRRETAVLTERHSRAMDV